LAAPQVRIATCDRTLQKAMRRLGEAVFRRELWLLAHREQRHQGRIAAVTAWIERTVSGLS
jgi:hypothetical protein